MKPGRDNPGMFQDIFESHFGLETTLKSPLLDLKTDSWTLKVNFGTSKVNFWTSMSIFDSPTAYYWTSMSISGGPTAYGGPQCP